MRVVRFASPAAFLAAAESDLTSAEAENNLILGSAHDAVRQCSPDGLRPYFAAVFDGDRVVMAAFERQPGRLCVTRCCRTEAVQPLAEDAWHTCPDSTAVIGPDESAESFAASVAALAGRTTRRRWRQRILELTELRPIGNLPAGFFRPAGLDDADTLTRWTDGFFAATSESGDSRRLVLDRLAAGSIFVWDCDGPVSMAAATGRTPGAVRVAHVYTSPEHRGKGYATACVAALTRTLLDAGYRRCCLYADVANPTSNAIYERLGYIPVCGITRVDLDA